MQMAPAPEASTVKDSAAVKTIPEGKASCMLVFAAMAMGPMGAVSIAPAATPCPMVMEMAEMVEECVGKVRLARTRGCERKKGPTAGQQGCDCEV